MSNDRYGTNMRDTEMGIDNFGGSYMYRALIAFLRMSYPEILIQWQDKVSDAVEYMEPARMED